MKETVLLVFSPSSANSNALIAGVAAYARQRGWRVHAVDPGDTAGILRAIEFLHPVGCLVGGHIDKTCGLLTLPAKYAKALPVVYLDRNPMSARQPIFCAAHDSAETGRMAAKELMDLDITSFAYVSWTSPTHWDAMRLEGFQSELARSGRTPAVFSHRRDTASDRLERLGAWLGSLPHPIGIFAANDAMAADVLLVAERIGLRVPNDLVVLGVDNNEAICLSTIPTLTSIAPDFERGGYLAARLLDERLANPEMAPTTRWFRPLAVYRRDSTARTVASDPSIDKALRLIRNKACEGLRAKDVIAALPGSRRYIERDFLLATGKTILQCILDTRFEKVTELLQNPSCDIGSIADKAGFTSATQLRRLFRERYGMSMSVWRVQNKS